MKQIKLAHLFLCIFFLSASKTVFCMISKRPSSTPPTRKYKKTGLKKIKSSLEIDYHNKKCQLKKRFEETKRSMSKHTTISKLEKIHLKIPGNIQAENLALEIALNQNPTPQILKITGIKSPNGENALQNLFQKRKKVKSPTVRKLVELYSLNTEATRTFLREKFGFNKKSQETK